MFVANGDRLIVEGDDAGVGDGDAEDATVHIPPFFAVPLGTTLILSRFAAQ
jgi:hypothetical protein